MPENETVEQRIRTILQDQLNLAPEEISEGAHLVDDLGCDSLDLIEILMALEEEFGIDLDFDEAEKAHTVADVVALVKSARVA